jgi:hypothetical protein
LGLLPPFRGVGGLIFCVNFSILMKKNNALVFSFFLILLTFSVKGQTVKVEFASHESENRIDVLFDGKLFTSYCWPENV